CKRTGAAEVLVCDYSAFRLSMAQKLGATRTVNPREGDSLEAAVRAATDGLGADRIFECVGREETFVQALTLLRKKGLATVVGIFEQPQITIPVMQLVNKEICVQGSQGYCWDFPIALQLAGEIGLEQLVTHRFPLAELQQALETALDRTQNTVKVVLKP
ncbi:MAG TPA: zinc-binding dehydrogenase, partial [Candidatus Limiplasma sp.]|nr:zinc-binding dehydrogenase [Candidatus Limiplasma sp.]